MSDLIKTAILGIAIIIGGLLIGGRFQFVADHQIGGVWVLDRLTGSVKQCSFRGCGDPKD